MRSEIFRMRILKVAIAAMLGTMVIMPFSASAGLVGEGRSEQGAVTTPAAGNARIIEDASFSAPAAGAHQANPASAQHNAFPAASPKFGTILAAALLGLA